MTYVKCDRCGKEVGFYNRYVKLEMTETFIGNQLRSIPDTEREVDLCMDCIKGLNLYLQRKVNSYSDLSKTYEEG